VEDEVEVLLEVVVVVSVEVGTICPGPVRRSIKGG